jgi:hypothetical protein
MVDWATRNGIFERLNSLDPPNFAMKNFFFKRGTQKLVGDNLKVVWA